MKRTFWMTCIALAVGVLPAAAQQAATRPMAAKHDLAGREKCLMCHNRGVMEAVPDVPEDHANRAVETCAWCHAPGAAMLTKDAPAVPHALAGREKCMMCHNQGVMEAVPDVPADHKGRTEAQCGLCHKPAS